VRGERFLLFAFSLSVELIFARASTLMRKVRTAEGYGDSLSAAIRFIAGSLRANRAVFTWEHLQLF
jgi:hypothetical protein